METEARRTLRLSAYAGVVPDLDTDCHLVYSNITGAVAIVDDPTLQLLMKAKSGPLTIASPFSDAIAELQEAGILVPPDSDDLALLRKRVDLIKNRSELDIIANLTLDCNMVCSYCFERKVPESMGHDTTQAIANYIESRCADGEIKKVILSLFGGEPLLNKPALRDLVELTSEVVGRHNSRMRVALITNGLLLDEETIAFLESFDTFLVQITIDGPQPVHDQRRRPRDSRVSGFEAIMDNVLNCVGRLPLILRVNVDQANVESLPDLFEHWVSKGLNRPGVVVALQRVNTTSSANAHYHGRCIEEASFDVAIVPLVLELRRMGFRTGLAAVRKPRYIHCGANTKMHLAIDPNGDLYTCLTGAGNPDLRVGNLFQHPMFNETYNRWVSRSPLDIPECRECDVVGFCGGGCAVEALAKHGDINRPACPPFRFYYKGPVLPELWRVEMGRELG